MALFKEENRPRILVTRPSNGGFFPWLCLNCILTSMGASVFGIRPQMEYNEKDFDGFILSGGEDIHPALYGQKSLVTTLYDNKRDAKELELMENIDKTKKPVLAICRGMELLNIFYGGTLYQELSHIFDDFLPTKSTLGKLLARHRIEIKPNTLLHRILKTSSCKVNSLHHQGINQLGEGLCVSARFKNGITQAIEKQGTHWVLGVQWHPEYIYQKKIFYHFLEACRKQMCT